MFDSFIEDLCNKEGLIDIGSQGIPSQSSYSKWSLEYDEFRPIANKVYSDYAFHTDKEYMPWWQINFNEVVHLHYIIINNRKKKPFDQIASNVNVYITNELDEDICIYSGKLFFYSLPDGLPLILPLQGKYSIKAIRVQLLGTNYLHLCNIYCLIKKSSQNNRLSFFSNRTDGLGERLKYLLSAVALASINKSEFKFSWPDMDTEYKDFHAISEVNKIFSNQFIEKHYLNKEEIDSLHLLSTDKSEGLSNRELLSYDGFLVQKIHKLPRGYSYDSFFKEIGFSDRYEQIKNKVESIVVNQKTVAIHLRAGDIVYSIYRFMNRYYDKVVPIYVLDSLIKYYQVKGYQIIVFGQDQSFCQDFCRINSLMYSENITDIEFDENERAFFDIFLMSKCEEIVAGSSGFASVASFIGNSRVLRYSDFLSEKDVINNFKSAFNNPLFFNEQKVHPLLFAFSISHFVSSYSHKLTNKEKIEYINQCISLDPDNYYYKLVLITLLYEGEYYNQGDKLVIEMLNDNNVYGFKWLIGKRFPDGTTAFLKYVDLFKDMVRRGSFAAAALLLMHEYYYEKSVEFDFYRKMISNKKNKKIIGFEFLQSMLKSFTK